MKEDFILLNEAEVADIVSTLNFMVDSLKRVEGSLNQKAKEEAARLTKLCDKLINHEFPG